MKFIVKKVLTLIITMLVISILTFVCFTLIPGDAALTKAGVDATEEQIEALREEMGLNDDIFTRYTRWLSKAVRGDFGESYQYSGVTVGELLASRMPVTLLLAGLSFALIFFLSIPLALFIMRHQGGIIDRTMTILNQVFMAVPSFFLGILVTYIFGLVLRWFSPGSFDSSISLGRQIAYMIFPAVTVAIPKICMTVKFLRSSMEGEMQKDYVRTARSKGADEKRILYRHVLRAAFIPVITFLAMVIAEIMAGSIVAEQVFSLNGIGRLLIASIGSRDYPVVEAIVVYITGTVVVINTIVDILYQYIDPRVRIEGGAR